jgi:hypothetical protein
MEVLMASFLGIHFETDPQQLSAEETVNAKLGFNTM